MTTKTCFVVGPIGGEGSDRRAHADWLLEEIIEPVFKQHFPTYSVLRADRLPNPGMIDSQMIRLLVQSELVIADLTFENPNAFYEIGIRHMVRKPIVHMHLEGHAIPFDVALHRSIKFQMDLPPSMRAARTALQEAVTQTEAPEFEVTNPVTHALGLVKIDEGGDPAIQVVMEEIRGLKDRVTTLEDGPRNVASTRQQNVIRVILVTNKHEIQYAPEITSQALKILKSMGVSAKNFTTNDNPPSVSFRLGPIDIERLKNLSGNLAGIIHVEKVEVEEF